MNLLAVIGSFIMTLAFLAYGIASVTLERFRLVGYIVLVFYSVGLIFELTAIVIMIESSIDNVITWHSILGMMAFCIMLINTAMVWINYAKKGVDGQVSKWLVNYTKFAFFFWVMAYLAGIAMIIWR